MRYVGVCEPSGKVVTFPAFAPLPAPADPKAAQGPRVDPKLSTKGPAGPDVQSQDYTLVLKLAQKVGWDEHMGLTVLGLLLGGAAYPVTRPHACPRSWRCRTAQALNLHRWVATCAWTGASHQTAPLRSGAVKWCRTSSKEGCYYCPGAFGHQLQPLRCLSYRGTPCASRFTHLQSTTCIAACHWHVCPHASRHCQPHGCRRWATCPACARWAWRRGGC